MKIAVYTIAKNEEQFVERWFNSAKDADYLLIADTGSNDGTIELARSLGINVVKVSINPWRFDDARNAALALLPSDIDYCVSLDMDEVLSVGWREELEKLNPAIVNRPTHKLVASHKEDGSPNWEFEGTRIHSRNNYRWKYPIHEVAVCYSGMELKKYTSIEIHHYPDDNKSRGQYLPLLKMAVDEDPASDRNAYYYGRELFFHRRYKEAAEEFKRHLNLPSATWNAERSWSMRYIAKCEPDNAEYWLKMAHEEYRQGREAICELATYYYNKEMWQEAKDAALKTLDIREKSYGYFIEAEPWGSKPHDILAISAYNLGEYALALAHGEIAYSLEPSERLANNLQFYKEACNLNNGII
jgi:glycosyltransferase involved in cell wall biosynthesis